MSNLVGNTIMFTDHGSVSLSTSVAGNTVLVSVTDTGIGISAESLGHLFQPFSQVASGNNRKVGSTGLGLAISRKIIQQHGGRIWADSRPGQGSTFAFCLPIVERRS